MSRRSSGPQAPVRVGRRDDSLLAVIDPVPGKGDVYVVTNRALRCQGVVLQPGTEVPGARDWPRVDAWVLARRIRPLKAGEDYLTFEDVLAALKPAEESAEPEGDAEPAVAAEVVPVQTEPVVLEETADSKE